MKHLTFRTMLAVAAASVMWPCVASAQQVNTPPARAEHLFSGITAGQQSNVPAAAQDAEDAIERAVRRFRIGVHAGVALDPELIVFGAHGAFAPVFHRNVEFRPGVEFGVGEITTMFGINLDVLYTLPGATRGTRWVPYIGAGPNFALSHRGFESDDEDDDGNRFDFSDTDFEPGFNFIAGARTQNGLFLEMKATAYGVSNIRLLVGFNF